MRLGVFVLGFENVEVHVDRKKWGASVTILPDGTGVTEIYLGMAGTWAQTLSLLVHELFELAMSRIQCRYCRNPQDDSGSGRYTFIMRHDQFSEVAAQVGFAMSDIIPKLSAAYNRGSKKEKK